MELGQSISLDDQMSGLFATEPAPMLFVFGLLWGLNGAGQALIAISSSTLLAEHTVAEERGRAYAAHFALTHACWLIMYPAVGHAAAKWGAPVTFTAAVIVRLLITVAAKVLGQGEPGAHTHSRRVSLNRRSLI
jgi:MFS transporter, NRE family, putaive nickel resistance protein